jgi:large subunit ribosomal protein L29
VSTKKKAVELRSQTGEQLRDRERELSDKLFNFRRQRAFGQLEKPSKMTEARRDLARVLTVLREKRDET